MYAYILFYLWLETVNWNVIHRLCCIYVGISSGLFKTFQLLLGLISRLYHKFGVGSFLCKLYGKERCMLFKLIPIVWWMETKWLLCNLVEILYEQWNRHHALMAPYFVAPSQCRRRWSLQVLSRCTCATRWRSARRSRSCRSRRRRSETSSVSCRRQAARSHATRRTAWCCATSRVACARPTWRARGRRWSTSATSARSVTWCTRRATPASTTSACCATSRSQTPPTRQSRYWSWSRSSTSVARVGLNSHRSRTTRRTANRTSTRRRWPVGR